MQKWEYTQLVIDTARRTYVLDELEPQPLGEHSIRFIWNELGAQGWEMVAAKLPRGGVGMALYIFKRPAG
jgi:hypothetical protein